MNRKRNVALDIIRGVAALEVMFSHLRNFLYLDFHLLTQTSLLVRAFYYITGFGHQAVIIFFVLSGYLVGGSVLDSRPDGFAIRYILNRLTRLWMVLVPCLLATYFWNTLGLKTGGGGYLHGLMNPPITSAPQYNGVHTEFSTFVGNLMFLQTIVTPVYGDNGPLWSLANEFWYYMLFPLLFFGLSLSWRISSMYRALLLILAFLIILFLPSAIISGFFIWLFGALIYYISNKSIPKLFTRFWFCALCLLAFFTLYHLSRVRAIPDILLGMVFAALLPIILQFRQPPKYIVLLSMWLSDFSYTIYLAHFPLAAFLWYTFYSSERLSPSQAVTARLLASAAIIITYCFSMFWFFERNTDKLRLYFINTVLSKMNTTHKGDN